MKWMFVGVSVFLMTELSAQVVCDPVMRKNKVASCTELKIEKKTGKKTFSSLTEFDSLGCAEKKLTAIPGQADRYDLFEWKHDAAGRRISYKEGRVDEDSSRTYLYGETFAHTSEGRLSHYRKDIYESDMSQTVYKWEYSYSDKGERRGVIYTALIVRKDTITNDEVKYGADGNPAERSMNMYFPKGVSEFRKYNSGGWPVETIRYEKGKMVSHRIFSFQFNSKGVLESCTITDGVARQTETVRYEKDKMHRTVKTNKGELVSSTTEPFVNPAIIFPPIREEVRTDLSDKAREKSGWTRKERVDMNKNTFIDHYQGGQLMFTETRDKNGLLKEKVYAADPTIVFQYIYAFY